MSTETFRFDLGVFRCYVINDGWFTNAPMRAVLPGATPADLERAVEAHGLTSEPTEAPVACILVDTGEHRILVDTGGGKNHPPYGELLPGAGPMLAKLGHLVEGLTQAGIAPESIDLVIITHFDPEHISGCANSLGESQYPNATFVVSRQAWAEFHANEIPGDPSEWNGWAGPIRFAQQQGAVIADQVAFVEEELEIAPGVHVFQAPSDGPHHLCVEFVSGDQRLICVGDAMHSHLQVAHPDWGGGVSESPQTRRMLLERTGITGLLHGVHFPFPGVGRLIPTPAGWRWHSIG